jgi:hypothetical protein
MLVGVILSTLMAGCSAQKGERAYEPKARQSTTGEESAYEFVGGLFDANELVAIVADKTVSEGRNTTVSGAVGGKCKPTSATESHKAMPNSS